MYQSTTPSLSQTIWPKWALRQFLTLPIVETLLPVTFGYSLLSDAVIMKQLRRWKRLGRRSLTRSHKRTSMGPSISCWKGTTRALQLAEISSKETRVSCVYYKLKMPIRKKSGNLFNDPRISYDDIHYVKHDSLELSYDSIKRKSLNSWYTKPLLIRDIRFIDWWTDYLKSDCSDTKISIWELYFETVVVTIVLVIRP